jgi:rare lipoprotein A
VSAAARPPPHASCLACAIAALLALAGCGSIAKRESPAPGAQAPASVPSKPATPRGGGYYLNDGPGDHPPPNLEQIPDAVPKREPLHRGAMRPYSVMGKNYTPMTQLAPYKARGTATWYGRRYHGLKTSSGETYDMYQMTAAHTTLPIPSFARITHLASQKSVVVRINDRGPFHSDRLIDLSYTAAYKLGLLGGGSALVEVETILADAVTPAIAAAAAPAAAPVAGAGGAAGSAAERGAASLTPAAIQEPAAATPVVAVTAERKGMFLQLGAFGSQDNADTYLARLRVQVDWLAPALHVYP